MLWHRFTSYSIWLKHFEIVRFKVVTLLAFGTPFLFYVFQLTCDKYLFSTLKLSWKQSPSNSLKSCKSLTQSLVIFISWILQSCTNVFSLQGISDCQEPLHDGNSRIHRLIHMEPVNKTHGNFSIDIRNITHDTLYCLRVELGKFSLYCVASLLRKNFSVFEIYVTMCSICIVISPHSYSFLLPYLYLFLHLCSFF